MGWIKPSRNREAVFDIHSYPMPKSEAGIKVCRDMAIPLGDIPKEKTAARFQQPNTFRGPTLTPLQVLCIIEIIIDSGGIELFEIKRRVGKNHINAVAFHVVHESQAVPLIKPSKVRLKNDRRRLCMIYWLLNIVC